MPYVDYDKCEAFGLDPAKVGALASRLSRAAKEAHAMGLTIFGGSGSGSLRYHGPEGSGSAGHQNTVAEIEGGSFDGGDGGDVF